jgi:hypothetical protein
VDSKSLSDYQYLGFIMEDRNLQKIFHTAICAGLLSGPTSVYTLAGKQVAAKKPKFSNKPIFHAKCNRQVASALSDQPVALILEIMIR